MSNRKLATDFIVKYVGKILPGSANEELISKQLNSLSDEDFDSYMKKLESGEEIIPLVAPILTENKINVQRNIKIARELNHEFFQRIWWYDENTDTYFLTKEKYLVIDLPLRRQIQILKKKMSIAVDNKHVDELTGQPSGVSDISKVSFPELQCLHAQGLDRSIEEMIKYRGGDEKGFNAMNKSVISTGGVSLDAISIYAGKVKSTETLSTYLKAMHLDNNL
jgi:hypothetical protein